MSDAKYYFPHGGLPNQEQLLTGRAIFKEAYVVIPREVMTDIVTSFFPNWERARAWVLAKPLSGFSTTFSQYIMNIHPGGGSERPEEQKGVQSVIFVLHGKLDVQIEENHIELRPGFYCYIPPDIAWKIKNKTKTDAYFKWIRKKYDVCSGIEVPDFFVKYEREIEPVKMHKDNASWTTTRFVDPADIRHDMHVNIVNFKPGGTIPFMETHVMEHGIYILQGKGAYRLNDDWVEVQAGDFLWLRAFCPQACYAGGPEDFRYLLYKDVNRQMVLP